MRRKLTVFLIAAAILAVLLLAAWTIITRTHSSAQHPEISFDEDVFSASVNATEEELLQGVTAYDPEDGDVTDTLVIESTSNIIDGNSVKVTYAAFDSKNHVGRGTRTLRYTDYRAPEFELSRALVFRKSSTLNVLNYVKATDVFDGDISNRTICNLVSGSTGMSYAGVYQVMLRTTNSKGDMASLMLDVDITDTEPNSANIQLTKYLVYLSVGDTFDPWGYFKSYETADGTTDSPTGITVESTADTNTEGIYYVTYSTTVGNVRSYTKLAVVVQ